jgi:hypothetical protein
MPPDQHASTALRDAARPVRKRDLDALHRGALLHAVSGGREKVVGLTAAVAADRNQQVQAL